MSVHLISFFGTNSSTVFPRRLMIESPRHSHLIDKYLENLTGWCRNRGMARGDMWRHCSICQHLFQQGPAGLSSRPTRRHVSHILKPTLSMSYGTRYLSSLRTIRLNAKCGQWSRRSFQSMNFLLDKVVMFFSAAMYKRRVSRWLLRISPEAAKALIK